MSKNIHKAFNKRQHKDINNKRIISLIEKEVKTELIEGDVEQNSISKKF